MYLIRTLGTKERIMEEILIRAEIKNSEDHQRHKLSI